MKGMNWQNDVSWVTVNSHRDSGRVGKERREMATAACQKLLELSTKIVAVGRNYAAHAKELGNAVPKVPFSSSLTIFFLFYRIWILIWIMFSFFRSQYCFWNRRRLTWKMAEPSKSLTTRVLCITRSSSPLSSGRKPVTCRNPLPWISLLVFPLTA